MHRIIYIDGELADMLGNNYLKALAIRIATDAKAPVDIITHGKSQYHSDRRVTGVPSEKEAPAK